MSRIVEKVYWVAVFAVPLLPAYAYGEYPSVRTCNVDGICFRTGGAILNGDAELIIYLSAILLWPMCAWSLLGKHIVPWRHRLSFDGKSTMKSVAAGSGKIYWLIVAAIPLLFWYIFGTFLAPHDCNVNRSCFQYYMPLSMESKVAVSIACCILWPLCAWKLFGMRWQGRKA